ARRSLIRNEAIGASGNWHGPTPPSAGPLTYNLARSPPGLKKAAQPATLEAIERRAAQRTRGRRRRKRASVGRASSSVRRKKSRPMADFIYPAHGPRYQETFPTLTAQEIARLRRYGSICKYSDGESLIGPGRRRRDDRP
ncbi:MAG: hypothetical protein ACRETP_14450, partial [Steroidobacteraceae bacterium]